MEYIITKRIQNNATQYLIKWRGKQHSRNTWESEQKIVNFPGALPLLLAFKQSQKVAQKKGIMKRRKIEKTNFLKHIVNLGKLKLTILCEKKERAHWMFGDSVEQILERNDETKKYRVKWQKGGESWEEQEELLMKQGGKMCQFFQTELNLPI